MQHRMSESIPRLYLLEASAVMTTNTVSGRFQIPSVVKIPSDTESVFKAQFFHLSVKKSFDDYLLSLLCFPDKSHIMTGQGEVREIG